MKIRFVFDSIRVTGRFMLLAAGLLSLSACNDNKLIEKVTFELGENLETLRVALVLTDRIQSPLSGGFPLKEYGYVFINPYTEEKPLEIGFYLNTAIVNEQDYVHLEPTTTYPNGVPLGLPYPIVQVSSPEPIGEKYDLFAYVDVRFGRWLGTAAIFQFIDNEYFPPGLAISQKFSPDENGMPRVIAGLFGPKLKADGSVERHGGIMLLANAQRLLQDLKEKGSGELLPESKFQVTGENASFYREDRNEIFLLQEQMIRAFEESVQ